MLQPDLAGAHHTQAAEPRATTPSGAPGADSRMPGSRLVALRTEIPSIVAGVIAVSVISLYVGYLTKYATNGVYWDEWNWVDIFRSASRGHLTLGQLWAQHNENRMLFPNLIMLAIASATRFTELPFIYFGAVLLIGGFVLLAVSCRDELRRHPLHYVPCVFIIFSLAQYQNSLWAFQFPWFLIFACISGVLLLLTGPRTRAWQVALALVLGVIASYSSLQGLTIWAAGLVALFRPRTSMRLRAGWVAAGCFVTLVYLRHLSFAQLGGPPLSEFLSTLPTALSGVLVTVGSVAPNLNASTPMGTDYTATMTLGGLILLAGCFVVASWAAHDRRDRVLTIATALVTAGILFDLSLMPSRLSAGVINGTVSRYTTFNLILLAGAYIGTMRTLSLSLPSGSVLRVGYSGVLVGLTIALVCIQVPIATEAGVLGGRETRAEHAQAADLTANFTIAPPSLVEIYAYPPSDSYFESLATYLHANRLNVFGDGQAEGYIQTGVVAGGMVTSVLPVPPEMGYIQSSKSMWRAWLALSSVYDQRPDLQTAFPGPSTDSSKQMIAWAVTSGLPANDPIYTVVLSPYAAYYRAWLTEEKPHG